MRKDSLVPAELNSPDLDVVDVGGGTGFCTIGIVNEGVKPERITLMDQSPHQLAKARTKEVLKGVTFIEGDAEDLPFETDSKDRYVSAGSIEYWPGESTKMSPPPVEWEWAAVFGLCDSSHRVEDPFGEWGVFWLVINPPHTPPLGGGGN